MVMEIELAFETLSTHSIMNATVRFPNSAPQKETSFRKIKKRLAPRLSVGRNEKKIIGDRLGGGLRLVEIVVAEIKAKTKRTLPGAKPSFVNIDF